MSARTRERRRRIEIPSAGQTVVSLTLREVADGGPWPLTRVLTALAPFDAQRVGVARALGDRRGIPLVHSQELRWGEHAVFIEARHGRDGSNELMLELPAWDELAGCVDDDVLWHLIDTVAAAADAQFGSIGDGEPAETTLPDDARVLSVHLGRHLALLLPEWTGEDIAEAGATSARLLQDSGLLVVTR
ncbi:MAG: hypothetical protein ABI352_08585 [Candidatus Dormibacter sp.]